MKRITLAALLVLAAGLTHADETASFLTIGVGARELALGGAGTALSNDSNALYWNAAGLSSVEKKEVSLSHAEMPQSTRLDWASFAAPTFVGTFAVGGTYLSQDAIEGREAQGHPTNGFQASDAAVSVGYGKKTDLVDLGASVKYIQSHIGSAQAETVGFDVGARKKVDAVTLAAALRDAGPGMKYDDQRNDLPMRLALGAAYSFTGGHAVALEVTNAPRAGGTDMGFGGEYQAIKDVFLRAGYTTQSAVAGGSGFSAARGLTLGIGYRDARWSLDYAALPTGELGTSHRFTLGARF